jgi:hypothetical protein
VGLAATPFVKILAGERANFAPAPRLVAN